jgi:Periplasmic binding protein
MPNKFNKGRRHKVPKARYRVTNWPDYDAALIRRGSLTVSVTEEAIAAWHAPALESKAVNRFILILRSRPDWRYGWFSASDCARSRGRSDRRVGGSSDSPLPSVYPRTNASSVALAVSQIAKEKNKILLDASAAAMEVPADQCSPNTIVWSFDTYEKAHSTGGALVKQGKKTWTFVTADYVFGHSLEEQTVNVVRSLGGEVKGVARYPFPDTTDFSAFLQQALASGAQVLGLANAGSDTVNCIKQANEFGLNKHMTIAPLIMFLQDVHSVGIDTAQGLITSETFLLEHE